MPSEKPNKSSNRSIEDSVRRHERVVIVGHDVVQGTTESSIWLYVHKRFVSVFKKIRAVRIIEQCVMDAWWLFRRHASASVKLNYSFRIVRRPSHADTWVLSCKRDKSEHVFDVT